MTINVIHYADGLGGVPRFTVEILAALRAAHPDTAIRLVSHGDGLRQYAQLLQSAGVVAETRDHAPAGYWRSAPRRIGGVRGTGTLSIYLSGTLTRWGVRIPREATAGCDVAWVPSLNALELPLRPHAAVVCTIHDLIQLDAMSGIPALARRAERRLLSKAVSSRAWFATSSRVTAMKVQERFALPAWRIRVIPTSGSHHRDRSEAAFPVDWAWANSPYFLYPAHLVPYKNHEYLIKELAGSGQLVRLILTGGNTHLPPLYPRSAALKRAIRKSGLTLGGSVIGLGYIPDDLFRAVLARAQALIMPSLEEGGGSFPVEEAALQGIPVLCSDIPVMREHMSRIGAEVLWFNPSEPGSLRRALATFAARRVDLKRRSMAQAGKLRCRTWAEVAGEYRSLFLEAGKAHEAI